MFISEEKDLKLSKGRLMLDDVVLTTRGTVGNIALFDETVPYENLRINSGMVLLRATQSELSPRFLYTTLFAPQLGGEVKKTAFGSAQPQLTVKGIFALCFSAPEFPEQRKIADFLTAVDGRLAQLSQKKALLEAYKKGVMQQLFTQALRFQDDHGNDFPDWEEKRVGDFAPLQRGFDLVTTAVKEGSIPVVYSNGILRTHNEMKAKGPGVVTGRSGTIGKVTFVEVDYWPHNTSLWVTNFFGNHPKFVYYFFLYLGLENFQAGSTIPTLNRNDVHDHRGFFPSPPEQTKIANFLTALDRRIEAVAAQIAHTRTWKKGLLEQMFV